MKAFFSRYKRICLSTALTVFFCYFYLMVDGYGGPDATAEGVHFYRNADWATRCGRWMIRYLNELIGKNTVIPFIIVLLYGAMIAVSVMLLCDMLALRNPSVQVLLSAAMISFPVVTDQFAYLYIATCYSFSFLTVTAGFWFLRRQTALSYAAGCLCFLLMLGSFQAYIGALAALGLLLLLNDLLREGRVKSALLSLGRAILASAIACVLNFAVIRLMLNHYHTTAEDRVSSFSVSAIFENLGFSLKYAYAWFFLPFDQANVLFRKKLYLLFFLLLCIAIGLTVVSLLKKETKKKRNLPLLLLFLTALALLPLAMNVCVILFPANGIYCVMQYHYVLIFPLFFLLCDHVEKDIFLLPFGDRKKDRLGKKPGRLLRLGGSGILFVLICTWTLTAQSTWILNRLIYRHTIQQATLMIGKVYDLDGFRYHETPVVLGGNIDYSDLRNHYALLFQYARIPAGPVLWPAENGMAKDRYYFFMEYMGFDAGQLSREEYKAIVNSPEFYEMPVWPEKGSVAMIGGYAVIKNCAVAPGAE